MKAPCSRSLRLDPQIKDPLSPHIMLVERVAQDAAEFDIIHYHIDYLHFPTTRRTPQRHLTTLHGRLDLPELYCGFRRQPGEGPTLYPVACSPQAWASGSLFMMLQASLGLTLDASLARICFNHPALPDWLGELNLRGLRLGAGEVDLDIRRHERDVEINVVNRKGNVQVIVTK